MFWVKKPTKDSPYAESKGGNYRVTVTKLTDAETQEPYFKYTAWKRVEKGGKYDGGKWDMLVKPTRDADECKRACVSDDRAERQARRAQGKRRNR